MPKEPNIVDTLPPEELPEYLDYLEKVLIFYDGDSKQVRETLRSQILLTKNKLLATNPNTRDETSNGVDR